MQNLNFKVPAIKISQRESEGKAIYFAKIKAQEFGIRSEERFIIDYYKRIEGLKDEGYQRPLSPQSVNKIKDFVIQESPNPILPTALILSSRVPLDFKQENSFGYGMLNVNSALYIIDGQHRFEAWKSMMKEKELVEKFGDYEFPLIILSGFESFREIEQFYVINSRQKKIKVDLAQRHLLKLKANAQTENLVEEKEIWKLHALKIVDLLNEEVDGVWKGKIGLPSDTGDVRKLRIINQSSFVSSLSPFFVGKNKIFDFPKVSLEDAADFLNRFWKIVEETYPLPIEFPHDYSLMKTVGVFSLHIFLAQSAKDYSDLKKDRDQILKKAQERLDHALTQYPYTFWKTKAPESLKSSGRVAGAFSSAAGHTRLAAQLYGF